MADPLKLLREFIIDNKKIIEIGDYYVFDDVCFKKNTKSSYLSVQNPLNLSNKEEDSYYTLQTLHFFYKNQHETFADYLRISSKNFIKPTKLAHRKDLISFFSDRNYESIFVDKCFQSTKFKRIKDVYDKYSRNTKIKKTLKEDSVVSSSTKLNQNEYYNDNTIQEAFQECLCLINSKKDSCLINKECRNIFDNIYKNGQFKAPIIEEKENVYEKYDRMTRDDPSSIMTCDNADFSFIFKYIRKEESIVPEIKIEQKEYMYNENKNNVNNQKHLYNRYDQEKFNDDFTAGFKINPLASFQMKNKINESDNSLNEKTMTTTQNVYENTKNIPKIAILPSSSKRDSKLPIIILPIAKDYCININNIKTFLENYNYDDLSMNKVNPFKDNEIIIQKQKKMNVDGKNRLVNVKYRCINNVLKIQPGEWNKVVAVFVHGPLWQFKHWPETDPAKIFSTTKGFYVGFHDQIIDPNIKKWNVEVLQIHRHQRHMDRAVVSKFWNIIDEHVTMSSKN